MKDETTITSAPGITPRCVKTIRCFELGDEVPTDAKFLWAESYESPRDGTTTMIFYYEVIEFLGNEH